MSVLLPDRGESCPKALTGRARFGTPLPHLEALAEPFEQPLWRDIERAEEAQQGRQADLSLPALDAADLDDREPRLPGETLLRPLALQASHADVCPEFLEHGLHARDRLRDRPTRPEPKR